MNWWHAAAVARGLSVQRAGEIPLSYFDAVARSPEEALAAHGNAVVDRAIARAYADHGVNG